MNVTPAPRPNKFEELALILGRGRPTDEWDRMKHHAGALVRLGYFVEQEFPLHNRLYVDGTNRLMFHQLLIARLDFGKAAGLTNDWWDLTGTESNKIVVTTTTALLPRWKKLAEDFDQP